jgi:cell division transport system permease protein
MIKRVVIIVKYNSFLYLIFEGFGNLFKNKKGTASSLITMISAMFLFGIFFTIGENINTIMTQVQQSQGMEVFIDIDATDEQINELGNKIKKLDGVNTTVLKTKQQALDSVKEGFKDYQNLLDGYDGEKNIFPASYIVTLTDLSLSNSVKAEIEKFDNVTDILSSDPTIETLIKIANGLRIGIGVIFVLLIAISVAIISNTIKLTVHARRKEISIMKYVGATNGFIRGPFIVEGIIIGIIAAIITVCIVGLLYNIVIQKIESSMILQQMQVSLLQFSDLTEYIMLVYAGLGIGIGVIGSSISMRKYLEV